MKKFLALILSVVICAMIFAGCGKDKEQGPVDSSGNTATIDTNLIGTWMEFGIDSELGSPLGDGWTFNKDFTGSQLLYDASFKYSADGTKLHVVYDEMWDDTYYTYVIEGGTLTLTDDQGTTYQYQKQ